MNPQSFLTDVVDTQAAVKVPISIIFFFRVYIKFYYNYIMSNNERVELHRGTASINKRLHWFGGNSSAQGDVGIHWQQTAKAQLGLVFISLPKQNTSFIGIQ